MLCACLVGVGCSGSEDDRPRIAVIPKGTTHVFWKSVERGARAAGDTRDLHVIWKGPLKENDRAQQIQVLEQFIAQGVDGIVLAPLDHAALVRPVREARQRGISVVIFDSALDGTPGEDFESFVATDNRAGGAMGGEHLSSLMPDGGDVVLLRYLVGSASTDNRESGFLEAITARGDINVLVDNRYGGATAGDSKSEALNLIDSIHKAEGIFCSNEPTTLGMLLALRQEGLAGSIPFVGFDASPPLVAALRAGEIDALVVQNPALMGQLAVEALDDHRRGESVDAVIDTGVVLVTAENIDDPDIAAIVK